MSQTCLNCVPSVSELCSNTHGTQLGHSWDTVRRQIANAKGAVPRNSCDAVRDAIGTQLGRSCGTVETHVRLGSARSCRQRSPSFSGKKQPELQQPRKQAQLQHTRATQASAASSVALKKEIGPKGRSVRTIRNSLPRCRGECAVEMPGPYCNNKAAFVFSRPYEPLKGCELTRARATVCSAATLGRIVAYCVVL